MFWIVIALTADQITKHFAYLYLQGSYIQLFNFFYLTYATNRGIAFGLFPGVKEVVIYLSLLIIVALSVVPLFVKIKRTTEFLLALVIGGALGNLIDRIRFGYVIDFLTMKYWPTVYNLADVFIFIGSIGLLIEVLQHETEEAKRKQRRTYGGTTGNIERKRMALGQICARKSPRLGLQNFHTESNKEWRNLGEWDFEEAQLQGEDWGYNYLESSGETSNARGSTREYTS